MRTPLVYAARHDVAGFLALELERRRELAYPPYSHLVSLVVSGPEHAGADRLLREIRGRLDGIDAELLGPAPLLRLRGRHRSQLIAKTQDPRRIARAAATLLEGATPRLRRDGLTAVVDVDPQ